MLASLSDSGGETTGLAACEGMRGTSAGWVERLEGVCGASGDSQARGPQGSGGVMLDLMVLRLDPLTYLSHHP